MVLGRRLIGVAVLLAISAALTWFWNGFLPTVDDFAANLYYAGYATVGASLCFHLLVVRRVLPQLSVPCLLFGVAISGLLSCVLYNLFYGYAQHITYLQREGTSVNWGDDGRSSGLGHYASGIHWPTFLREVPAVLKAGCLPGLVWLPFLAWLEEWSYADLHEAADADQYETQAD
jgi:hypothetical protein